ncbi:MAG: type IV secretory system conjugative DNA transfer family protein, partial [Candidatus Omnitrophota bacterium]
MGQLLGAIFQLVFAVLSLILKFCLGWIYHVEENGLLWIIKRKFRKTSKKDDLFKAVLWLEGYLKAAYFIPPARYFFYDALLIYIFAGDFKWLSYPLATIIFSAALIFGFLGKRHLFMLGPQALLNEIDNEWGMTLQVEKKPYGSAKWITPQRLLEIMNPLNSGLTISGAMRESLPCYNKIDLDRSFKHLLVLGTSGSRKTQNIIIPNILEQSVGSMVIMDPKGELYEKTATIKHHQGYKILKFDPLNIHSGGTSLFNPLNKVKKLSQAKEIAHIIMSQNQSDPTDPFWRDAAESLLAVLIMLLKTAPNGDVATFSNVKRILVYPDAVLAEFVNRYCNDDVQEEFIMFMRSSDKVRQSILATMLAAIKVYGDEHIRHASTAHNLDLAAIRKENTTLYLC